MPRRRIEKTRADELLDELVALPRKSGQLRKDV